MERRLLVAFLLSTALIMAYQFFYAGPKMRRSQELQRAQQERLEADQQKAQETLAEETPPADTVTTPAEPEEAVEADDLPSVAPELARFITIATPLYEVTLSTLGGNVVAVRLLDWETDNEPVQLIRGDPTVDRGILQLSLAGDGEEVALSGVLFDAFSSKSVEPMLDGTTIRLDPGDDERVVFRGQGVSGVEREYVFNADHYVVRSGVHFTASTYPFARQVVWSFGPGLRSTEKNQKNDFDAMRGALRLGDEFYNEKRGDFAKDFSGTIQWAALQVKYFTAIMIPETPVGGDAQMIGIKDDNFISAAIRLPTSERRGRVDQTVDVYLGPLDYKRLKTLGRGLEKNVDIGFNHIKIFKPVSVGILWSMVWLYKVIPNYGLVIIIISALTKVLFYRLTHKSFKSMRDMQSLQPKLQSIKEKYKDDRQKQSSETMKLYKEAGVNPLGGCLPMLLQMPVFIALFSVLRATIELRRAPFFGWMDDLSQQDVLFDLPVSLPVIGTAVSVLPILMGVSMLVQSKIGGSIAGPSSTTAQPKAFMYMLPVVFTFLFYKMPSGLVLYWLVNTVLSVAQQYYINKGADKEEQKNVDADKPTQPTKPVKQDKPALPAKPNTKSRRKKRSKKG